MECECSNHGGASGQRGLGPLVEVVDGGGAHKGELHVRMGIDTAGQDELAGGIDDSRTRGCLETLADLSESSLSSTSSSMSCPSVLFAFENGGQRSVFAYVMMPFSTTTSASNMLSSLTTRPPLIRIAPLVTAGMASFALFVYF